MDKNMSEEKLHKFFAKAFHEVVVPLFEDLKENVSTKDDINKILRKLDKHEDRMDRHGKTLDNHEGRIVELETN